MTTPAYSGTKQGMVQSLRSIRDQISREIKDMSFEQERAYLNQLLAEKSAAALAGERNAYSENVWIEGESGEEDKGVALARFINDKFKTKPDDIKHKNVTFAICQTGEVIELNLLNGAHASDVLLYVYCEFDKPTGGQHFYEYYKYTLIDSSLSPVDSNCFEWNGFKCFIIKHDSYTHPLKPWHKSFSLDIRMQVVVSSNIGEEFTVNFLHNGHNGYALEELLAFLANAKEKGLSKAVKDFKDSH